MPLWAKVLKQLAEMRLTLNSEPFKYLCDKKNIIQSAENSKLRLNNSHAENTSVKVYLGFI